MKQVRIGDLLKERGYITEEQIEKALLWQKDNPGYRIGDSLITLGMIRERELLEVLGESIGLRVVDISTLVVDLEAVRAVPRQLAEMYTILPVKKEGDTLEAAMNDPMNYYGIEDVRQVTGLTVSVMLAEAGAIKNAISYYYSEIEAKDAAEEANRSIFEDENQIQEEDDADTPVTSLLNHLIQQAHSVNASDIHIEPFERKLVVRQRIDGVITEFVVLKKMLHTSLIARIKILAEMDIAERRVPQDGHFRIRMDGEMLNIRVSMIPTIFGEKAVLRLLSNKAEIDEAAHYGMKPEVYQKVKRMISAPNGIIYLTGPTGSGKTTTLYMILKDLAEKAVSIATIEDPVEKTLPKISQMQVNSMAGLTFEQGLRALLRQDPDIIMLGETRDFETASISARASITGHLVFSTLHTNDSVSSIVRLEDMGLEPYLVSSSLVGIVAQRLLRKLCKYCSVEEEVTPEEQLILKNRVTKVRRKQGCRRCNNTGYRGRIAIHEVLIVDTRIKRMIVTKEPMEAIVNYAVHEQGMKTLHDAAIELVEEGVTSIDEMKRIVFEI